MAPPRTRLSVWVAGARPRTLGASIVPVVVGTVASTRSDGLRAGAALLVAMGFQIGVNYANDYFDGTRGVDTRERVGPVRLVASGLATPRAVAMAAAIAFGVAASAGAWLAFTVDLRLLLVGAAALAAAVLYSGGPKPYAGLGLGELFVFLFFGPVAVAGTAYVQAGPAADERVVLAQAWWAGVAVGLLAVAILIANNVRDIATDAAGGKRTLAVRLGDSRSRALYRIVVAAAFGTVVAAVVTGVMDEPALLALGAIPVAIRPLKAIGSARGRDLVPVLIGTAATQAVFGVLLAVGLVLSETGVGCFGFAC